MWGAFLFPFLLLAQEPDWSATAWIPPEGRANPYELMGKDFHEQRAQGQVHAHQYPVTISGILIPERPVKKILEIRHGIRWQRF